MTLRKMTRTPTLMRSCRRRLKSLRIRVEMARAFTKSFPSAPCMKTTMTTKKLNIKRTQSLMEAVTWITQVSRTFPSWSAKSTTKSAHHIRQAKVETVKSVCRRLWVHSEILGTGSPTLRETTLRISLRLSTREAEVDGRLILLRSREIPPMENLSSQNSSLARLLMILCRNILKAARAVQEQEAHVKVQSKEQATISSIKSAQASSRPISPLQDSTSSQISSRLS